MSFLNKIRLMLNSIFEKLTVLIVIVMVVVVAAQVFFRYVLHNSLYWSEELAIFLFIWLTFIGGEIVLRNGNHIAIDALLNALKGVHKLLLSIFIDVVIIAFACIVLVSGVGLTISTLNQPSAALQVPMAWVYGAIPISMILMIINTSYSLITKLTGKSTHTSLDYEAVER
jgi:TRAP-type C4-dicarboxylate transport system permease small subunit